MFHFWYWKSPPAIKDLSILLTFQKSLGFILFFIVLSEILFSAFKFLLLLRLFYFPPISSGFWSPDTVKFSNGIFYTLYAASALPSDQTLWNGKFPHVPLSCLSLDILLKFACICLQWLQEVVIPVFSLHIIQVSAVLKTANAIGELIPQWKWHFQLEHRTYIIM